MPARRHDDPAAHWPHTLWLVRHGQSAGNVARDRAEAAGEHLIDIAERDVDVPLSPLGERQADAVGRWFGRLPEDEQPQMLLCSPYVRAIATAERLRAAAGLDKDALPLACDERLREKEFGILDRYTVHGIRQVHPTLAEQRAHVGKFYFRPPGGESWCDVILRLRSVLEMIAREHAGCRVLIVAHQVTVNCFRYLLEGMSEAQILAIDAEADVPNCGVTHYVFDAEARPKPGMVLRQANFVSPLTEAGETVTRSPDVPAAPKP
jgi:broad specificity phosphatase PhoE